MTFDLPIKNTDRRYTVRPTKIVALGLNYREHIAESVSVKVRGFTQEEPAEPLLFPKAVSALLPPGEAIVLPSFLPTLYAEPRTDYEGELAFFIGKRCKNAMESEALDYVYGFTCANDVSQRNIQTQDKSGWFRGKSLDTFCPVGPCVVPLAHLPGFGKLALRTRLNGKLVQDSGTERMIFPIESIVAYISKFMTLEEGDLILTGTPQGVGPLVSGDIVEVEIEGIGTLANPVTLSA